MKIIVPRDSVLNPFEARALKTPEFLQMKDAVETLLQNSN
jgi:hypothetical protein